MHCTGKVDCFWFSWCPLRYHYLHQHSQRAQHNHYIHFPTHNHSFVYHFPFTTHEHHSLAQPPPAPNCPSGLAESFLVVLCCSVHSGFLSNRCCASQILESFCICSHGEIQHVTYWSSWLEWKRKNQTQLAIFFF